MNSEDTITVCETKRRANAADSGIDLLSSGPLRAVVSWRWFPQMVQAALLVVFVGLALLAWGVFVPGGVGAKLFAKSNLVTLLIWGLWWPAMVWAAVLLGRAWCMICPLELVSSTTERAVERLGWRARELPRWIAGGSVIVLIYFTVQLMVPGAQLHRTPGYTAIFLFSLLGLAFGTALFFRHRAFCRGFCPVGLLLGTYGRGGMLAVRPGPESKTAVRDCPSLLVPAQLDSSKDCLVCCRCIKRSEPGGMRLLLRPFFAASDARQSLAPWPVTLFVMMASGFVIAELCTEWAAAQKIFLATPHAAAQALGVMPAARWMEGIWTLLVVPLALWTLLALSMKVAGRRERIGAMWRTMALPMAVIVAAGHMTKGLAKFLSWLPFLPDAVQDPRGAEKAFAITKKTVAAPPPLLPLWLIGIVGLALIVAALAYAIREHRRSQPPERRGLADLLPYGSLAALFLAIVAGWTIQ